MSVLQQSSQGNGPTRSNPSCVDLKQSGVSGVAPARGGPRTKKQGTSLSQGSVAGEPRLEGAPAVERQTASP
eukprot:4051209-Amphidinium_carterae.1